MASRMATIAITTASSVSVNPPADPLGLLMGHPSFHFLGRNLGGPWSWESESRHIRLPQNDGRSLATRSRQESAHNTGMGYERLAGFFKPTKWAPGRAGRT